MDGTFEIGSVRAESRWFDDFELGERFELPARPMTPELFHHFLDASGETHPLHSDPDYCRAQGHPDVMAHGFQVLIQTTAGAGDFHFLVEESLVGLIEQSSRFVRPVFAGDALYPVLQVVELAPNTATGVVGLRSTVHNQRRELVLEGSQRYLLRMRPR
jgi:acyl dehydratase